MANVPIPENPEYSEIMRIIETTDPGSCGHYKSAR